MYYIRLHDCPCCTSEDRTLGDRAQDAAEWPAYGHDPGGAKYSPLDQVNTENVSTLAPAWINNTGDLAGIWEETPIVAGGVMYFATQKNRVIALHP